MSRETEQDSIRTLQVLFVARSPEFASELELALDAATEARVSLRSAVDFGEAEAVSRARLPDLVCIELGQSAAELHDFVASLQILEPDLPFVGIHSSSRDDGSGGPEVLVEAVRSGFLDVIERPISSADLRRVMPQVIATAQARESAGRVIAFHSTKGGVGKSTLSVNVSCGLAQLRPDRVLLVDASLQLGVCAVALDLQVKSTVADAARERDRLDERLIRELAEPHESGLRVLASPVNPIDAADVDDEALARIIAIGRRAFDYVVVDTLPTVDGAMLTILDLADHIFLVNQGTVPDVIGAARLLETLDELEIAPERRSVVLNRNLPPFAGALTAKEVGDRLGQEVDYEIPHDKKVLTGLNLGQPRVLRASTRFGWGRAMRELIEDVDSLHGDEDLEAAEAASNAPGRLSSVLGAKL